MFRIPTEKNLAEIDENLGKAKIQRNNSSKNITKIKGITQCPECKSDIIWRDEHRDEIDCSTCGLVIRQGLEDLRPDECSTFQMTSQEHQNKKYKKNISSRDS